MAGMKEYCGKSETIFDPLSLLKIKKKATCQIVRFSTGQLGCDKHESVDLWVWEDCDGNKEIRCKIWGVRYEN